MNVKVLTATPYAFRNLLQLQRVEVAAFIEKSIEKGVNQAGWLAFPRGEEDVNKMMMMMMMMSVHSVHDASADADKAAYLISGYLAGASERCLLVKYRGMTRSHQRS